MGGLAATVLVALAVIVPLSSRSPEEGGAASESPAQAEGGAPPDDVPVEIGGVLDIWLVGSPHEESLPSVDLPDEFGALLDRHGITPNVSVHGPDSFADDFYDASDRGESPEIFAGENYGPLEPVLADPYLDVLGASGPIESVVNHFGFVYLPADADRHDAAVQLAIGGGSCLSGGTDAAPSIQQPAIDVGQQAIRASIEDPGMLASLRSAESNLAGGDGLDTAQIDRSWLCTAVGNDVTGLVHATVTLTSAEWVGQFDRGAVVVREAGQWKVLALIVDGPPAELLDAFHAVAAGTAGGAGDVDVTLLYPDDGDEPAPTADNYQEFYWSVVGDEGQVVAQFLELTAGRLSSLIIPAEPGDLRSRAAIGHSGFGAPVHWRAWVVLADGTIVFSPTRTYEA
jgi:hypothetical protein